MNQICEPVAAIRCGLRPDGSDTLYRPAAIGFAPSRTSVAAGATTTADGFGDFVGWGDAVGDAVADADGATELDALGEESVVAADAGGAELALAAVAGT